ncbi:MAG: UvrB/UvrC motif-containing protein [Planctomycetia bacterium]|nr:UvrB/UvrC motif-containing protein [Planctomycetia bacterium]
MKHRQDIDQILKGWKYEPGEVAARLIRAGDGRELLQMRIDMGVLQLEVDGRPDGERPEGAETYFDYLLSLSVREGDTFRLDDEQCEEADREFVQFYQRRICWLALREFRRAMRDADHSLAFMDFVRSCSPNEDWTASHEQYRPFIIFHRTQAAALAELEDSGPEAAVEAVNEGLARIRQCYLEAEIDEERIEDDELTERLHELRESVREHYHLGQTLAEQLADAVAAEEFERAARLRDEIARRSTSGA